MTDQTPPEGPQRDDEGRLTLTQPRTLLVAFLLGLLIGWGVVLTAGLLKVLPPQVPWSAPIALLVAAVLVGIMAYATYQRIQVKHIYIDPQRAVSLLVLGKASAQVGVLVVGGYLAFGLMFLSKFEAETPRERVVRSAVAIIGGVCMAVAGLFLERACKVPDSGSDVDGDD